MAWNILSAVHKVRSSCTIHMYFDLNLSQTILTQVDRDSRIIGLVEIIDDVYSFVKEAEPIKKIESHGRIIALMAQQTTECAYFIRDYAMNKSFCRSASTFHLKVSHRCVRYKGNEPSNILSCRMLTAPSSNTRTGSKNSRWLFKIAPFFRPGSPSPAFSTILTTLVGDLIYHVVSH